MAVELADAYANDVVADAVGHDAPGERDAPQRRDGDRLCRRIRTGERLAVVGDDEPATDAMPRREPGRELHTCHWSTFPRGLVGLCLALPSLPATSRGAARGPVRERRYGGSAGRRGPWPPGPR